MCYPSHIFFLFEAAREIFAHANHIVCQCLLGFTHLSPICHFRFCNFKSFGENIGISSDFDFSMEFQSLR
ncbi:hypothetical protein D2923_02495 [Vibrio cholerae]|nr:hypothetical protein D2B32_04210 [Vibrio cholerae]TLE23159.1 hypothetical protein D2923_02495 [Vibrio cholerae]